MVTFHILETILLLRQRAPAHTSHIILGGFLGDVANFPGRIGVCGYSFLPSTSVTM